MSNEQTKTQLRKTYRQRRQALSSSERAAAAHSAAQHLIDSKPFQTAEHIACYLAYKSEMDCSDIISHIWQENKKCFLPVLTEEQSLVFVPYHNHDELIPNQFGILEPAEKSLCLPVEKLELVIMPLVAFDKSGNRLGTGGGYYDRTFGEKASAFLMGLAYDVQCADQLPTEEWDVGLDGVLTESGIINFT